MTQYFTSNSSLDVDAISRHLDIIKADVQGGKIDVLTHDAVRRVEAIIRAFRTDLEVTIPLEG